MVITNTYNVGDYIYFHAYARNNRKIILLCKGIVSRLPNQKSPVFKIVITNICKTAIGTDNIDGIARDMIGMTIPCLSRDMFRGITDIMAITYDLTKWIDIEDSRFNRIRSCKTRKD